MTNEQTVRNGYTVPTGIRYIVLKCNMPSLLQKPGYAADCTMNGHDPIKLADGKSWEVEWLDVEIVGCQYNLVAHHL